MHIGRTHIIVLLFGVAAVVGRSAPLGSAHEVPSAAAPGSPTRLRVGVGAAPGAPLDDLPTEARGLLKTHLEFSDANISALARGQVVRKTLETKDVSDVVAVGAVRVNVPREFLVSKIRDIVNFKKSAYVLEIGTLSTPPRVADLERLTLPGEDVDAIRECRPGDCAIKLTGEMLERLQKEVEWSKPGARTRATGVFRRLLVEQAAAYLSGGSKALGRYVDKPGASTVHDNLSSLLNASTYLDDYAPELRRFLGAFPRSELRGVENFLYWSKESFGAKPVISVTHIAIFTKTVGDARMTFVASSGLYTSHYFESSLGLTMATDALGVPGAAAAPGAPRAIVTPAVYLVYVNRSRVDALKGTFSSLRRLIAVRRVRDGLDETLKSVKKRLEQDYATLGGVRRG